MVRLGHHEEWLHHAVVLDLLLLHGFLKLKHPMLLGLVHFLWARALLHAQYGLIVGYHFTLAVIQISRIQIKLFWDFVITKELLEVSNLDDLVGALVLVVEAKGRGLAVLRCGHL